MPKKASSRTKTSARRATTNKAIAATSARAAKVTKAVHLAVAKAVPNVQISSPSMESTAQGIARAATAGAGGPGTIEPKLRAYLVFVVSL
jgi:hypothetical protein